MQYTRDIDTLEAVEVAEGARPPESEEHYLACWQKLVDTGIVWQLQGWFGRTATMLLSMGRIEPRRRQQQEKA
jgi:hypothetical protein